MNLPAGKAFGGIHDLAIGNTKRYDSTSVKSLVANKAVLQEIFYWPFLLSPIIFSVRWIQKFSLKSNPKEEIRSDVKMPPRIINQLLYLTTKFENKWLRRKPWGSSIFVSINK